MMTPNDVTDMPVGKIVNQKGSVAVVLFVTCTWGYAFECTWSHRSKYQKEPWDTCKPSVRQIFKGIQDRWDFLKKIFRVWYFTNYLILSVCNECCCQIPSENSHPGLCGTPRLIPGSSIGRKIDLYTIPWCSSKWFGAVIWTVELFEFVISNTFIFKLFYLNYSSNIKNLYVFIITIKTIQRSINKINLLLTLSFPTFASWSSQG